VGAINMRGAGSAKDPAPPSAAAAGAAGPTCGVAQAIR
jgi:hypothetical protein